MATRRWTTAALSAVVATMVGGAAAAPAQAARDAGTDPGPAVSHVIRCVVIEQENFCTELGFVPDSPGSKSFRSRLDAALTDETTGSGDESLAHQIAYLETLSPRELAARQKDQIDSAKESVGKAKVVDALTDGTGLADGFFEAHPALGIAEHSALARALRLQAANPDEMSLEARLRIEGVEGGLGYSVSGLKALKSEVPYPPARAIMLGYAVEQEKSYWCGPATMQSIDWANDGTKETQTYWSSRLGTTTSGTAISTMVSRINSDTTWDDSAGPYAVASTVGKDATWIMNVFRYNVGLQGSPVLLHPQLLHAYHSWVNFDHGGHFQPGIGYDATTIELIEVYDERDWRSGGAASAGYQYYTFQNAINAQNANSLKNIGY